MNDMTGSAEARSRGQLLLPSIAMAICSAAFCFMVFAFSSGPRTFIYGLAGTGALAALLLFPEFALALYVVIGDLKGDDRIATLLPVDLTLALGSVLVAGAILNFLRGKQMAPLPRAYFCFIGLTAWMTASLSYTPVFDAGLEKLERFLSVTGVVIVAPFLVLGTPQAMKRFFIGFGIAATGICTWSLFALGGAGRLVTPSDNTIGLGHIACALIVLIWFAVIPRFTFPQRLLLYPLLAIPGIALIGSGARGSVIACAVVILAGSMFMRARWTDLICVAILGAVALPFLSVPAASFEYLGTLIRSHSAAELFDFRSDLLQAAWQLIQKHPLIGGGIQSFRYYSANPSVYNWPHNIFVEVACELGIPAALLVCAIFAGAFREAFRQLRDDASPYFSFSFAAAALLVVGFINGLNTGDINSDRTTWLFVSLVFVVRTLRQRGSESRRQRLAAPAAVMA